MVLAAASAVPAMAQQPQLATFSEQIQIIIDGQSSVRSAVSLLSVNNQEIMVPPELAEGIIQDGRISAVVITNEERCVPGVVDESCILVNIIPFDPSEAGTPSPRDVGDLYIGAINTAFGTDAQFHSVFVQSGAASDALGTSGAISGAGVASVVYVMPTEPTAVMFQKMAGILIPDTIRDSGGFYDVALGMSSGENAGVTFSMIVQSSGALYQLKVSTEEPTTQQPERINPLEYLAVDEIRRSGYYSSGFYPLNSLLHVVILSDEPVQVSDAGGKVLSTYLIGGEKVPADITQSGWIFDPAAGLTVDAKFLFGTDLAVDGNGLFFTLAPAGEAPLPDGVEPVEVPSGPTVAGGGSGSSAPAADPGSAGLDDTPVVVLVIVVVAVGVALYYLRGYKKGP